MVFKNCLEKMGTVISTEVGDIHSRKVTVMVDVNKAAVGHSGISCQQGKGLSQSKGILGVGGLDSWAQNESINSVKHIG